MPVVFLSSKRLLGDSKTSQLLAFQSLPKLLKVRWFGMDL